MATGTGTATIDFGTGAQAAVTHSVSTFVDNVVFPMTWASATTAPTQVAAGYVAYGNGYFVSITSANSNIIAYSTDGINWTSAALLPSSVQAANIVWTGTYFVITPTSAVGTMFYASNPTVTWSQGTLATSTTQFALAANPGTGTVISFTSAAVSGSRSTNFGASWAAVPSINGANGVGAIGYGGGTWVVLQTGTTTGNYSTSDGASWSTMTITSASWRSIAYGNGKFVAVASGGNGSAYMMSSPDGINWTAIATAPTNGGNYAAISFLNGMWVLIGYSVQPIFYSKDLVTWASTNAPVSGFWYGLCAGTDRWVAACYNTTSTAMCITNPSRTYSSYTVTDQVAVAVAGSNTATAINITGLASFTNTDNVEVWLMGSDSTSDHNQMEHAIAPIKFKITNPISGVGFTINATSEYRLTGTYKVRYCWAS